MDENNIIVNKDIESQVKEIAEKLMGLMGLHAKVETEIDKTSNAININFDSQEEAGLIIGKRGETLQSIQSIMSLIVRNKLNGWVRIIVNIGDWREKNEDYLKSLADQTAQRAKETKEPQNLYNLNSAQRRVIHMYFSEDPDVETESVGEGDERYLIVKVRGK